MEATQIIKLYSEIQLAKPLPQYGFQIGDAATVVEEIKDKEGKIGFILEFFDNEGKTLLVIPVDQSFVQLVQPHSVVNYRPYVAV